jgi:hypothetical protein
LRPSEERRFTINDVLSNLSFRQIISWLQARLIHKTPHHVKSLDDILSHPMSLVILRNASHRFKSMQHFFLRLSDASLKEKAVYALGVDKRDRGQKRARLRGQGDGPIHSNTGLDCARTFENLF